MFTQIHISVFILSALLVPQPLPFLFCWLSLFFSSSMKTFVSSLNVMIWTRVWETYSQKGKLWLCQSQNPTLIAIRSAKMTVREASWRGILLLRWLPRCWVWALPSSWGGQWVLLFLALYFGGFFFSPCVFGGLFCLTYLSFWSWTLLWGSPFEE